MKSLVLASSQLFGYRRVSQLQLQYSAFSPLSDDWTVVEESADAGQFNENEVVFRSQRRSGGGNHIRQQAQSAPEGTTTHHSPFFGER